VVAYALDDPQRAPGLADPPDDRAEHLPRHPVARHVAEEPAIGERVKRACRTAPIIRPETPTRPGS